MTGRTFRSWHFGDMAAVATMAARLESRHTYANYARL
jgi:hypothetical protein